MRRTLALCVCLALAGCGSGKAVHAIAGAVRQLPGVVSAESDSTTVTAVLDPTAGPEQGAAVGRTFTDLANRDGLADVGLTVDYPGTLTKSTATFPQPAQGIPDSLRAWLDIARSPGVAKVDWSDGLRVTVGPAATDADLNTIARNHPKLTWLLIGLVDPLDSSSKADLSETYQVTGMVPDQKMREQWNRIVAKLGDVGHVAARTDAAADPPTNVTVNIPTTYGNRQQDLAQAWMTFPLLEALPLPARVEFGTDIFTVGGCTASDPSHASSDLETELRQKFERC